MNEILFCNADGKVKSDIIYGDTLYLYFRDKEFASVVNQGNVEVSPTNVTWKDKHHMLAYYVEANDLYYSHDFTQGEGIHSRLDKFDAEVGSWDVVSDITTHIDGSKYNGITKEWEDDLIMIEKNKPVIPYKDWDAEVVFGPYSNNGNTAIQLMDPVSGEPISTSTVNMEALLPENVVMLKDWSENTGTIDALFEAGVIKSELIMKLPAGFEDAYAYELTDKFEAERQRQYEDNDLNKLVVESRNRAMENNPFARSMYNNMFDGFNDKEETIIEEVKDDDYEDDGPEF